MMFILFVLFNIYITSINGFFYTLLPLTVIKKENTYKAYCPWNQTKDGELKCEVNKGVMGYFHLKTQTRENSKPEPENFLNPSLQKRFSKDKCKEIKDTWGSVKGNGKVCNKYSFCYNVADDKSVCSCQNGFFGDPYTGCHQHCSTDDDCSSPLARCAEGTTPNQLSRCVCKEGYEGDGVLCHTNVCGTDRRAKCGGANTHKVCVPTGSGSNDFACICETGYFLNHKNECVQEFTVRENTVITLVGKNIVDGSRVELGDCLSFVINDKTKSIFYHKNSGDSIFVRNDIKNDKQFSIFFIVTKEVTAFSLLKTGNFGLTKLYSMTNTFLGCKFGNARIFDPEGHDLSEEDSHLDTSHKNTSVPGVSTLEGSSALQTSSETQEQQQNQVERQPAPSPPKPDEKTTPLIEVYVRDLTEGEKSGGLSGSPLPPQMVQLASQEEEGGLELGSSRAKGHTSPSHLQVTLPPETARELDL